MPAFTGGILTGRLLDSESIILAIMILAFTALICVHLNKQNNSFHMGIHGLLFLSGIALIFPQRTDTPARSFSWEGPATVCEASTEKAKTYKTVLLLDLPQMNRPSKFIAYIKKSAAASKLMPGDRILLTANLTPIDQPALPGEFNYSRYLSNRGIHHSAFVREDDWNTLNGFDQRMAISRMSAEMRSNLAAHFDQYVSGQSSALLQAMFLGDRSGIEKDTRDSFAKAGIVHILAVSGLHVGIIYMIVSILIRPLTSGGRQFRNIGVVIEVTAIWAFAIMTGLGPSVQRAAFMFSLFSAARVVKTDTHPVNITAASAVMLLVVNPMLLFSTGFQLSYAAVFGILLTYPVISKWVVCKNRFLNWVWQMEVVSFGAVAGTAPISIYYFHQFPLAFPIANLIALPAAFLLVCGAAMLIAVKFIPVAASVLGILLSHLGNLLVSLTTMLANQPLSHIRQLYISRIEVVMLYLAMAVALITVVWWKSSKRKRYGMLLLILVAALLQVRTGILCTEYRSSETYLVQGRGIHLNIGKKQYRFIPEDMKESTYQENLSGHWKYDHIHDSETFYLSPDRLDSFRLKFDQGL